MVGPNLELPHERQYAPKYAQDVRKDNKALQPATPAAGAEQSSQSRHRTLCYVSIMTPLASVRASFAD